MRRLRILLPGTDPEPQTVRIPFISYCHGAVLAQLQTLPWSFERAWTLAALREGESKRMILSKNWAPWMLSRCFSAVARRQEAASMAIDSKVSIRYARFP
jgi:hypothetical protein